MVLRRARASKRSESSKFQYRKRVPRDVRALVGGPTEVKVSLQTHDPDEAKRLHSEMDARFGARWAQIRRGIQELDDRQVSALAGEVYRDVIGRMKNQRDAWAQHAWMSFRWGMGVARQLPFDATCFTRGPCRIGSTAVSHYPGGRYRGLRIPEWRL